MTDPARLREILDSYGGHADRWPDGERGALLGALRGDAGLRAVREEALHLDAMLDQWACRDLSTGSDAGAVAARVLRPARRWPLAAGGIAASVVAALLLFPAPATEPVPAASTSHAVPINDEGAFAGLFTATPDEEDLI